LESQKYKRLSSNVKQEEDNEDLFVSKKADIDFSSEHMRINPMQVTQTQMRKIKVGGVFKGENIFDIDDEGNLISNGAVGKISGK
jgi:hypothetical protein